jgi:hypothetical protein
MKPERLLLALCALQTVLLAIAAGLLVHREGSGRPASVHRWLDEGVPYRVLGTRFAGTENHASDAVEEP